jgi:hypothetical protein
MIKVDILLKKDEVERVWGLDRDRNVWDDTGELTRIKDS